MDPDCRDLFLQDKKVWDYWSRKDCTSKAQVLWRPRQANNRSDDSAPKRYEPIKHGWRLGTRRFLPGFS
ncbi:hypothetical protein NBRC111894_253 [Sporolactobacillus inulinus]|uniref:Uncharacterized protein n=1 Tax=Sporolactobacillus inulinus TaxID=2078 RepID=A0A4Y1Z6S8_9BACL|nr:hypothetical protein NBRC111894_253 [Sporolactobacillus inulinus]